MRRRLRCPVCGTHPPPPSCPPTQAPNKNQNPDRRPHRIDAHVEQRSLPTRMEGLVELIRERIRRRQTPRPPDPDPVSPRTSRLHPGTQRPRQQQRQHRVLRNVPTLPDDEAHAPLRLGADPWHQPPEERPQKPRSPVGRQRIRGSPEDQRHPKDHGPPIPTPIFPIPAHPPN